MSILESVILYLHIIAGFAMLAFTSIMQLIVGPAMSKISASEEKKSALNVLKKRRQPIVDTAIIIQTVTGLHFLHSRWALILESPVLLVKVFFGVVALSIANMLHFYFRRKKAKMQEAGETDRLAKLQSILSKLEKVVLISVAITVLLAVYYNHM